MHALRHTTFIESCANTSPVEVSTTLQIRQTQYCVAPLSLYVLRKKLDIFQIA